MTNDWTFHEFEELGSTNDFAKNLAHYHAVRAEKQSAGRGQRGRRWHSQKGGLWASYVLPDMGHPAPALSLGAAIILHFRKAYPVLQARLRYPNDLMLENRKFGGILIEKPSAKTLVVGLGINLSNSLAPDDELRSPATRLKDYLQATPTPTVLFNELASVLKKALLSPPDPNEFWAKPALRAHIKSHRGEFLGYFLGTTPVGSPILKTSTGSVTIPAPLILEFKELV